MLFALGTTNIPKTNALRDALERCPYLTNTSIEIKGFKVDSGVPDMPLTLAELRAGACNRAKKAREYCQEADFAVGMEGGVYHDSIGDEWWIMGVVYIEDKYGVGHFGYTVHLEIPHTVRDALLSLEKPDLEQIMEKLGHGSEIGDNDSSTFGALTDDMILRKESFRAATHCALAPFWNKYYSGEHV